MGGGGRGVPDVWWSAASGTRRSFGGGSERACASVSGRVWVAGVNEIGKIKKCCRAAHLREKVHCVDFHQEESPPNHSQILDLSPRYLKGGCETAITLVYLHLRHLPHQ